MPAKRSGPTHEGRLFAQDLEALGIDLEATLRESPEFLLDPRFLGALHGELAQRLSPDDARAALLQLGFLHGLRDATRVLRAGFEGVAPRARATAPRLTIHWGPADPGTLEMRGHWPDQREATAIGPPDDQRIEARCHVSAGYTAGWLSGIYDADLVAVEQACVHRGDAQCGFQVREAGAWRMRDACPPEIASLPLSALREIVARHLEQERGHPEDPEGFEAGSPVVHVWGPVMVIPFAGADESLRALDLIGRDPAARGVRVVVIDLSGAYIDEGFGAAALEQILDAVEGWGAEPLLAGVSPLSARVVADLGRTHGVLQKDLPDAIAVAFQVADAQRRPA